MLCSVVKHLGSGRALKKWGKTLDFVSCFPLHFFRALPLPACFTTEQSTVEASLFVKERNVSDNVSRFEAAAWGRGALRDYGPVRAAAKETKALFSYPADLPAT